MAERAIGFARHASEIGFGDALANKGLNHLDGDFGVRLAGKTGDGLGVQGRPGFRHVEAAVAGEPGQHGANKIELRGFAPR
jgi:hypothetical protein